MYVDHVRVQRLRHDLATYPLSPRARQMLDGIADGSFPPLLVASPFAVNSPCFGDELTAADEFDGPFRELDERGLVVVDGVIGKDRDRGGLWVTLRLAYDLPHRGQGLLS